MAVVGNLLQAGHLFRRIPSCADCAADVRCVRTVVEKDGALDERNCNTGIERNGKMQKTVGEKVIKIAVGIVGLAVVFFLGKWISTQIYHRPAEGTGTDSRSEAEENLQPPKAALTEEELEMLFRTIKDPSSEASGEADSGTLSEADSVENDNKTSDAASEDSQTSEGSPEASGEIDFPYLWTINEDIIAWITIPGTNIDYPILQHPTDDSYYLNHNIDGSYGYPACIYTESLNSKDFTDPNTVIYGHNLKAKTMFSELHKFENRDFFEEHDEIIIYLPDKTLYYRIFAAHVYDDRHLLYSFDFSDENIYSGFLQSIYDIRDMNANINRDITVTSQDRIISLETCMPNKSDAEKRLLVHAVLLEEK